MSNNCKHVATAQQLVAGFDARRLSELKRPWGDRVQKVGKKAAKIPVYADVLTSGKERMLGSVAIPDHPNYVMFDFEGLPPHCDELEKIYLWGMQVYGNRPSPFMGVPAGFGLGGDREGWMDLLDAAQKIFDNYGDIPFVHWHHYERVHIDQYVERYGDPDGIAARAKANLLDLLPITKSAIALHCQVIASRSSRATSDSSVLRRSTAAVGQWRSSSWRPRRTKPNGTPEWRKS